VIGARLAVGDFLTGHAADKPGVTAKLFAQAFELSRARSLGLDRLDRMLVSAPPYGTWMQETGPTD